MARFFIPYTVICILLGLVLPSWGQSFPTGKRPGMAVTTYILVRHAEKANDGTKDPPLNENGEQRAERLGRHLATTQIDAIYSTDFQRTKQTVTQVAREKNMEVTLYDPSSPPDVSRMQKNAHGKTVLVAGHSNTVPAMVNQLIGEERFAPLQEEEYDKLFIVSVLKKRAKVIVLTY